MPVTTCQAGRSPVGEFQGKGMLLTGANLDEENIGYLRR